ncbi:MAG: hemolysin family protein [Roseiflexaceae bacterium]|nr:hemolysin family protein [Roseiflexaceae bacterium]
MELALILVLCIANGLFSATELSLISARRSRLQPQADAGQQGAIVALQLQEDPNRLLSTVQIGITLIGTLAGAFGGTSIATQFGMILQPWLGNFAETTAFVVVVAFIAYLQLVIGELVPKRLALQSAEAIAIRMAQPMLFLAAISRPVVWLLTLSTEGLLILLGRHQTEASGVTEEDIRQIVREGAEGGALEPQEHAMIERVIRLGDRSVRQVMTPRHALKAVDGDRALGSVIDELLEIGFSRFPIYERQLDHVIGIAHIRDLLRIHRSDPSRLVRDAMRPPLFVPERSRAAALLAIFRKQQHMAVVVSELGTVEGVITLEDVLEEIVGEIADEYDEAEEELFVERDDGSFLIAGLAPIDRVQQTLAIDAFPEEERYSFETLAGFILSLLGHMPHTGDKVDWSGWRFEVVDMDGLRIDKVLASPLAKS